MHDALEAVAQSKNLNDNKFPPGPMKRGVSPRFEQQGCKEGGRWSPYARDMY